MDLLSIECQFTDATLLITIFMLIMTIVSFWSLIFGGLYSEDYKIAIISIICFIVGVGTLCYINGNKNKYKETITQYHVNNESLIPVYAKNAYNYNYENKILTIYEKGCQTTERSVAKNDMNK